MYIIFKEVLTLDLLSLRKAFVERTLLPTRKEESVFLLSSDGGKGSLSAQEVLC